MKEKKFKLSFIFTVLALLLFSSITVFAAQSTPSVKRLSGADRYATSAAVALNGWTQSNYAILASGENFPDAISAAPLAKKYDAPILLSEANSIPTETLNAIQQLKVKNIIIVGGTGSISAAVEKQLASSGIAVTRIFGQDRYETCIKIAEQLDNVTEIAVVTGESFPDALSISPIAVKRNMPIILVSHNEIPSVVKDYINSHKLTTTYVIGSGTSLNNAVLKGLSNIELVTGNDKYQVNLNIIDKFKSDLNLGTVYVASGEGFADALSGSILAGKNSNPLLLIGNDPSIEKNYFANNSINISNINVLGGIGVVPDEIINKFTGASATTTSSSISTPPSTSKMDKIEFVSTNLTKTGANTATFQYRVLDKNGVDITKTVPASEIGAVASPSSSIILDPLTGKGTITFNSPSDNGNQVIVTLIDKVTGKLVSLNNKYSEPQPTNNIGSTSVAKIEFISTVLTKTGMNTTTFQYRLLDKNGVDITKAIPASEINAVASVSSSIVLDPLTGKGTITFNNASSTGDVVIITLVDNINGIVGTIKYPSLNPGTPGVSESQRISRIMITSTKLGVAGPKLDGSPGNGYAIFEAYDQNENVITNTPLAKNIKFTCDAGTVIVSQDLITVVPNKGVDLATLKSVVITAADPNTGVSISATLIIDPK
ncbi:cell wall-binding repeat-containing protein [Clostridium sp. OS1-26]|uniref:cell wall-binding repeat-containing protein n=1 Tax=Clostridium sp. OS1-26 TaxID=3070681 RepID=UPI0027E10DC9|nr:cell wall-binding repeat-containing protein [Clostridium sp. OS1-26]WML32617.1 cell wall-binding repeat-containing protein [Clostridium sp. OS1-26]